MNHQDTALEKAREELTFWRDYAAWWHRAKGTSPEPRLREALQLAEQRYQKASRQRQGCRSAENARP